MAELSGCTWGFSDLLAALLCEERKGGGEAKQIGGPTQGTNLNKMLSRVIGNIRFSFFSTGYFFSEHYEHKKT